VSLSWEVLGHVATCTTFAAVWKEITDMFASQSRARTIQLQTHLATMHKGEQSAAIYYNKMKGFADEMAAAGKPLEVEDFISYVLAGLDQDYNSFMENVMGKWRSLLVLCTPNFWQPKLGLNCRMHRSINPRLTLQREDVVVFVAVVDGKETVVTVVLAVILEGAMKLGPPLDLEPCVNFAKRLATRFNGARRDSAATSLLKINL
jgi:hypothetical protein